MQISSMGGQDIAAMLQQMQAKMQTAFSASDKDGDGKLSKTEFASFDAAMKADAPQGAQGATSGMPTADQMFTKMDTDGDGSVTMDELKNGAPQSRISSDGMSALLQMQEADGSDSTNPIVKAFKAADTDGDGKLSKTEFAAFDAAMKAQGPGGAGSTNTTTATTDDTTTTTASAGGAVHHHGGGGGGGGKTFDALDTNQDGEVSAEELAAADPTPPTQAAGASTADSSDSGDLISSLINQLLANYKQNSGADIASAMTATTAA